jgi:hypothetical protein
MKDADCEVCHKTITRGMENYSQNTFRKSLCFEHQKEERLKTYPKPLAEMMNKAVDGYKKGGEHEESQKTTDD